MHFEVPKSKSLREFFGEYFMIVISIGTALGLEYLVQTQHHKHLAQEAAQRMQEELRATLQDLDKARTRNKTEIDTIRKLQELLLKDIEKKTPEQEAMKNFNVASEGKFGIHLMVPTLKHEAWDVAVANQSASWMAAGELQRYSAAYAALRDTQQETAIGMNFLQGAQMLKTFSDLEMGSGTPKELFYTLNQMKFSYQQVNNSLSDLRKNLATALELKEEPKS